MELARIPIDTSKLSIGMYVAMLDRPWLETPFIFQGFEIKDRFEIEQLQSYCGQVFVDVARGTLTEAQVRALAVGNRMSAQAAREKAREEAESGWLVRLGRRLGLGALFGKRKRGTDDTYRILATVRQEAPLARKAWERAVFEYRHLFQRTRRAGAVDIEVITKNVLPLIQSILRNPNAMAWTVFAGKRSGRIYSRAVATAVWAVLFGRHLGADRKVLESLAIGGLLLDIGNVTLPDELLQAEGAISQLEYQQVPKHVEAGMHILNRSLGVDPIVFEMVQYHHERCDGSGYPQGLAGSDIPPYGRIAGIVDCYDAMTTRTSYSPALAGYDAARQLNEMRHQQFHAEVVTQFLHTIGMFPNGSVVELSDGSVGLVLEQNRGNPLQPKVLLLRSSQGTPLDTPGLLNPQDWPKGDDARKLWIAQGHEHGAFGIDPMAYFS